MSGFGDVSDEEEIMTPSPRHSPKAATATATTDAVAGQSPRQAGAAGLSRLERLERLASAAPNDCLDLKPGVPGGVSATVAAPGPAPGPDPEPEVEPAAAAVPVTFSNAGPLGLSFRGGRVGEGTDVIVAQVAAAGAAAGLVQPGMVLRQVQGASVAGKTHDEVIGSIRQAERPLTLVFIQPALSPLPAASGAAAEANSSVSTVPPEEIKATFTSEGRLGEWSL